MFVKGDYKYNIQMMAEEEADRVYGKDFDALPEDAQDRLYTEATERYFERGME